MTEDAERDDTSLGGNSSRAVTFQSGEGPAQPLTEVELRALLAGLDKSAAALREQAAERRRVLAAKYGISEGWVVTDRRAEALAELAEGVSACMKALLPSPLRDPQVPEPRSREDLK